MTLRHWNRLFDRIAQTRIAIGHRRLPAFPACGAVGLLLATGLAASLTAVLGLSFVVMAGALLVACLSFLALAMATKVVTGEERLVFFRHQVAALTAVAALVHATGSPLLPYLDVAAVGVSVFLVCGRVGCLMVGCCHGLPSSIGPRYGRQHTAEGFPAHLEGVRLLPLQIFDGAAALAGVVAGVLLLAQASGSALSSCVGIYAASRFHLDCLRGAPGRRLFLRLTESQWTSLLQLAAILVAARADLLPPFSGAAGAVALAACILEVVRKRHEWGGLLDPGHVGEIARGLRRPMTATSRGILLSARTVRDGAETILVQTVSSPRIPLSYADASLLAHLIARLRGSPESPRILAAAGHTYHVLVPAPGEDTA